MLLQGRFSIFFLLFFLSCSIDKKIEHFSFSEKDKYLINSFKNYKFIYNQANDSLKKWINDSLYITKSIFNYNFKSCWELDSNLVFNSDSSLFFSTVLNSNSDYNNAIADAIEDFYGRRINGKWYFFFGASTVLPREYYQDSVYSPLSFEELSYLAYKERFEYYVDNNKPLPEDFFDDVLGAYLCKPYGATKYDRTQVNLCLDSLALTTHAAYHAKKMTKEEIAEIQKAMDESVRPPESLKKSKEWWQFWKATPIFETEEWKNYLKQKYGKDWEKHR